MSAILTEPPSTLVFRSDTPRWFEHIVQRCLEKNPADRFQSARELALALDSAIDLRSAGPPRPAQLDQRSVAVLPFTNMSADPEDQ